MFKKKIGILAGNGAAAGAYLYSRLIGLAQEVYASAQDEDFPQIVLLSNAIGDLDELGNMSTKALKQLDSDLTTLTSCGCEIKIVGCNTMHTLFGELSSESQKGLLNMIDLATTKAMNYKKVAVLCSDYLAREGSYDRSLSSKKIETITLTAKQQELVNSLILIMMGSNVSVVAQTAFDRLVSDLIKGGAESIIVGCTELSMLVQNSKYKPYLIDAVEVTCLEALTEASC